MVTNCQYKRVESSASTTLTCTSMPQPNECNDVQNINGEVWQTVNFSKKKKNNGRENEAIQQSGTIPKLSYGRPGKSPIQSFNFNSSIPINLGNIKTKTNVNHGYLSTPEHVTFENKFRSLVNLPMDLDSREASNSKVVLGLKILNVAPHKINNGKVSFTNEPKLANMTGDTTKMTC